MARSCVHPNPSAKSYVDEVRNNVGDDGEERHDDEVGHDRIDLGIIDSPNEHLPHPGPGEDLLGDERSADEGDDVQREDRKSTRLNSSHVAISYAVFCLKKER